MEARATYYHVLLRAVKDPRGKFRPVIADGRVRWRDVSNEGFKDEFDAKDAAELMALAYIRRQQPDTSWEKLKAVPWRELQEEEVCDFCDQAARTSVPDVSGIPVKMCEAHSATAQAGG
jgi:hypothetical protein